jgi:hypothetical protein
MSAPTVLGPSNNSPAAAPPAAGTEDSAAPGVTRIQLSRKTGWRMPQNTVKVDRTTRWGNYAGREAADQLQALAAFIHWLGTEATDEWKMAARGALRGKNLACWCKLGQPCHADYLLGWLNAGR